MTTSTWMMIFFIISLVASIWKIYAFLPNKELADDDTTDNAQEELMSITLKTIQKHNGEIKTLDELYTNILINEDFNKEKFWRFNTNKLKKLLELYYLQNPEMKSIEDIYTQSKGKY